MRSTRVLALDCGAAHLTCGLFVVGKNGEMRLEQYAYESYVVGQGDDVGWTRAVGDALKAILSREKFNVEECILAVPGHLALTKFVKTPAVDRDKRDRIVQFEASQNIPYPLDEVSWDYVEVAEDGVDVEVMLSAIKLDAVEALCAVIEEEGLQVTRIEPSSLSLCRAHHRQYGDVETPVLLVDIGARSTHLLFVSADGFYVRTLSLGGSAVTQSVAKVQQSDFAAAEKLKLQNLHDESGIAGTNAGALADAFDEFVDRLQLEITRSRLGYSRQYGSEPPEKVILTGGGARLPKLSEALADKLNLPVQIYDGAREVSMGSLVLWRESTVEGDSLAVLVGLVASTDITDVRTMNLLPTDRRESQLKRGRYPWWVATAALIIAAFLPGIAYYHMSASKYAEEAASLEQRLIPLRQLDAQNRKNLERIEQLRATGDVLSDVVASRDYWLLFLADLQKRLGGVGDVWFERLELVAASPLASQPAEGEAMRLALSGRLLDTRNPTSKASADSYAQVKQLIKSVGVSRFVERVENERFDSSQPGLLYFQFTLVMDEGGAP